MEKHLRNKLLKNLIQVALPKSLQIGRSKKHVSIIVSKNKIISIGINQLKTHPKAKKHGYRFNEVHSELDAFLKIKKTGNYKLFNFRFNRFGEMRMSRPCKKCMSWCSEVFDDIYFTTPYGILKYSENHQDYIPVEYYLPRKSLATGDKSYLSNHFFST